MFIQMLDVSNYKGISEEFSIELQAGLNVIVGENGARKTAVIDAIRLMFREDEFGRTPITDHDFHNPINGTSGPASQISFKTIFRGLSSTEQIAFLPWSDLDGSASLTMQVDNKEHHGNYRRHVWGGASKASAFEWELFDSINCIYLPPLRDAEAKLREGKSSRLARLLKNLEAKNIKDAATAGIQHPLVEQFAKFNKDLCDDGSGAISKANKLISDKLEEAVGSVFGQSTQIQFSEVSFGRIAESLRLFFFPDIAGPTGSQTFRSLTENSLGYNNLLYLATVLAELVDTTGSQDYLKILLIEEPEAHLHPQLQIRLLSYLEKIAKENNVQVIVTTHSPVLASSASISSVIHLSTNETTVAVPLRHTGIIEANSDKFLERWLDATKSTLLFAKGNIFVEGIAEAFILPELATKVLAEYNTALIDQSKRLPIGFKDAGVSVINMNGIYFKHFMQLFCDVNGNDSVNIPVRCSGITDLDPAKTEKDGEKEIPIKPHPTNMHPGKNPVLERLATINASDYCRLYSSPFKTLEYDLAMEGNNIQQISQVLYENWPTDGAVKKEFEPYKDNRWDGKTDAEKADAAYYLLGRIDSSDMSKGQFAQHLAEAIANGEIDLKVPEYIKKAILWACGGPE